MLQARPSFALDHQAEAEIARRNAGGTSAGTRVADEIGDIGAMLSLDDAARKCDKWCMITETSHQCPYCDLRFEYHNEVKDHVLHDHPERADF